MELSSNEQLEKDILFCIENDAPANLREALSDIWLRNKPIILPDQVNLIGKIVSIADDPTLKYKAFEKSQEKGYDVGWTRLQNKIKFRTDELSVFTGINGHGKSMFVGQLCLDLIESGATVLISSLEMRLKYLYRRMMRQMSGVSLPDYNYIQEIEQKYAQRLFFLDHLGSIRQNELLEYMHQANDSYGCDVFVVDSLMKCGLAEDDYNEQKKFVDALCDFKSKTNTHVILVVHPRKGQSESQQPGKMDVKGTGTITDLADNCFTLWRNKKKEEEVQALLFARAEITKELEVTPDARFACVKQRNGDWEGSVPLWFNQKSLQYISTPHERSKEYCKFIKEKLNGNDNL